MAKNVDKFKQSTNKYKYITFTMFAVILFLNAYILSFLI